MEEDKKVYIGNLEFSVTEEELKKIIEEKGIQALDVRVVKDKFSGKSKGFGFAEFQTPEDAQQIIIALDGFDLKGRKLRVSKAKKMEPRSEGGYRNFRQRE